MHDQVLFMIFLFIMNKEVNEKLSLLCVLVSTALNSSLKLHLVFPPVWINYYIWSPSHYIWSGTITNRILFLIYGTIAFVINIRRNYE